MSSLGYARDSMGDLLMASRNNNNREPKRDRITAASNTASNTAAAPPQQQQQQRKPKRITQTADYSGFTMDYAEYEQTFSNGAVVIAGKQEKTNIWCCLLAPWQPAITNGDNGIEEGEHPSEGGGGVILENYPGDEPLSGEADGSSASSFSFAASEAEEEKKAIDDDDEHDEDNPASDDDDHDDDLKATKKTKKLKPILKRNTSKLPPASSQNPSTSDNNSLHSNDNSATKRRSLFPQSSKKALSTKTTTLSVSFSPMARVQTVKSREEMSLFEKSQIWWQKNDYNDFKTTGRLIAKAAATGGSEVWLASNNQMNDSTSSNESKSNNNSYDPNKWWHKFGHSRRGLEHIASSEEGRQRQATLRQATRAVTEEQRRQRIYRKEDSEKLRLLSLQYTTWARDLALAAAASDAEAVKCDFDVNRKSREFFLLKHSKKRTTTNITMSTTQLPSFMMGPTRAATTTSAMLLDQNTSTQLNFRRKQLLQTTTTTTTTRTTTTSTKKQAQGFGTMESDVSRILSGMGSSNSSSNGATRPPAPSTTETTTHRPSPTPQSVGAH